MHSIELRGARTNNLRDVSLRLEPGTLVALTGPSGAGKSSLAFGTLYAEGQRRYVESFSAYARQFLERKARPPIEALEQMPAAIAVDRAGSVKTSRSTVATLTELSDYFKQLYAHAAQCICPRCGGSARAWTAERAAAEVIERFNDTRVVIGYPVHVAGVEGYLSLREQLARDGYRRVLAQGAVHDIDASKPSEVLGEAALRSGDGAQLHVVVDRAVARADEADARRIREAVEVAFARGDGRAYAFAPDGAAALELASGFRCDGCGHTLRRPSPGLFSFNTPIGACAKCRGFGRTIGVDWNKVLPDPKKTLAGGAIKPWGGKSAEHERKLLARYCKRIGLPMDVPLGQLDKAQIAGLIDGDGGGWRNGYPGLRRWFAWLETRAYKMHVRVLLARYRSYETCEGCDGHRFKPEALGYRVAGLTLAELYALPVERALSLVETLSRELSGAQSAALGRVLEECRARLLALSEVGLPYLTLDRSARSLSGGELQRVALTSALGSGLTGTLFVLDEPTVGLHPRDVERLLPALRRLAARDNVVLVVESDQRVLQAADRVVELGPGAGPDGGTIVFDGPPDRLPGAPTKTGAAWTHPASARPRRTLGPHYLELSGARGNNLQDVALRIPLGAFTCVTGVSGSGKSSLIAETLVPALQRALELEAPEPLAFDRVAGQAAIQRIVIADQAPLGRTSRGNAATYTGVWDLVRKRLAKQPLAVERGYGPGTFSFNVAGGRCEACKGEGADTVEMQFLADVQLSCPECGGRRFVGPVLDVTLCERNVAELLELTVEEAHARLSGFREIATALQPLIDVGAGYLRLGQPLSTLSGGEAQRLKLAQAIAGGGAGTLLVLDEPTAGLHASDVPALLRCLDRVVEAGGSVLVIEHDMRVAAHADHVIDVGPGAGEHGGRIVATGTPEEVARCAASSTAPYLRAAFEPAQTISAPPRREAKQDEHGFVVAVRGASEHNLKHVDVDIPRDALVVVTGPSGSGKSTLAFDVVFAEAQRRYLETLSPYVRQYLAQLPRAAVDRVDGMPPGVSLEQQQTVGARSSTVATLTEVAHYLRLVYARAGLLRCADCKVPIAPRSAEALAGDVATRFGKKSVELLAPIVRAKKGSHRELLARMRTQGFSHAQIDGERVALRAGHTLERFKEHDVAIVVGEGRAHTPEARALLLRALELGQGAAWVHAAGEEPLLLSTQRACPRCGRGYPEPDPRFFSFNTKQGQCETCEGRGVIEHATRGRKKTRLEADVTICAACEGQRLSGLALHTTLDGERIQDVFALSVRQARARIERMPRALHGRDALVAELPLRETLHRLAFLERVGLDYLSLDRGADTLSGGELQRVRLAAQLGSGLTGVLYVLDEPTIGLHPRDTGRLLGSLRDLVGQGCSVLVVEHDLDTITSADHVIDVGPVGGQGGGRIVAQGAPKALLKDASSITGRALARPLVLRDARRPVRTSDPFVEVLGAREHNLKDVDLRVPIGRLTAVTGVSGSGKSTLVREVFLRAVLGKLERVSEAAGAHDSVRGHQHLKRAVEIDQTPIGRTPRSVPVTYIGVWDAIRALYAQLPEARSRGYGPARFSFNVAQGRCPDCEGQGSTTLEMSFLPDALVRCESCDGLRFSPDTLSIRLHGKSIGELLRMQVSAARELLAAYPKVHRPLALLEELGLHYLELGQPSNTLSGGEAQRLKLASELALSSSGGTLYVMDEPTTGLHRDDVARLLNVLDKLVERGDTVVVIEHNPDVMAFADWLIDLGPEGGAEGGRIVASGSPKDVLKHKTSHTAKALRAALGA